MSRTPKFSFGANDGDATDVLASELAAVLQRVALSGPGALADIGWVDHGAAFSRLRDDNRIVEIKPNPRGWCFISGGHE